MMLLLLLLLLMMLLLLLLLLLLLKKVGKVGKEEWNSKYEDWLWSIFYQAFDTDTKNKSKENFIRKDIHSKSYPVFRFDLLRKRLLSILKVPDKKSSILHGVGLELLPQ